MSVPTLPTVDPNATLDDLRNQVAILQKTITFYLTSNLSSDNAYEFGGWLIGEDSLMSIDGAVGLSSAITGADDIRIWAGNSDSTNAAYRVYESGHVYASNLTMVGGNIDWSGVIKPTYTPLEVGAVPNTSIDVYNTLTNFGLKRGLFIDPATGNLYINADDIHAGHITAAFIDTTNLAAERIYQVGSPNNYAVLGGAFGDMDLYRDGTKYFSIYNGVTSVAFKHFGTSFLTHDATIGMTSPNGTWDFLSTDVQNLKVTAKFG